MTLVDTVNYHTPHFIVVLSIFSYLYISNIFFSIFTKVWSTFFIKYRKVGFEKSAGRELKIKVYTINLTCLENLRLKDFSEKEQIRRPIFNILVQIQRVNKRC